MKVTQNWNNLEKSAEDAYVKTVQDTVDDYLTKIIMTMQLPI